MEDYQDALLVKALGDDKPGRLKGMGFGATKTKMVVMMCMLPVWYLYRKRPRDVYDAMMDHICKRPVQILEMPVTTMLALAWSVKMAVH